MHQKVMWGALLAAVALLGCVLCLDRGVTAAPPAAAQPFANSIEQRMEMLDQLREISSLLKEQNALLREQAALLRSGEVRVIVTLPPEVGK